MLKIFVSFGFRPEERDLVRQVETLLESHGALPVTGEYLGGQALTPAIKSKIDSADALLALLTPRELKQNGRYSPSAWVRDEINYAKTKEKDAIAMVHSKVDVEGMYADHERIDFDPDDPLPGILKLSSTLGEWRQRWARLLRLRILPEELAARATADACTYRFWEGSTATEWKSAVLRPEPGGLFALVRGGQDDWLVEVRIELPGEVWTTGATQQAIETQLRKVGS